MPWAYPESISSCLRKSFDPYSHCRLPFQCPACQPLHLFETLFYGLPVILIAEREDAMDKAAERVHHGHLVA